MNRHSLFIVGIMWVLVFLSQRTESSGWLPSEILAVEEQQSRLGWDLTNCFLKGSTTSLHEYHIDRSVSSINIQTQELAQTSKNVQEHVNDVLDQSLKTPDSQIELQNSQTKMNERLDEGMTTLDESTNNLGKEMINLKNKVVEIEKEIVQAAEAVLKMMDVLQNKADDIKNKLDKQKQLVRSQTIALEMLQTLVDKVNKLRNKNDDDGYNDDVDRFSWINSDITKDELDDLEYVPPKGVPETSFITKSLRNYNLRSRH
nr:protein gamete expressed 1-like isoform X1 [Tanacetum cinerariifolium]